MGFHGNRPKMTGPKLAVSTANPSNPLQGDMYYQDGTAREEGVYIYEGSNGGFMPVALKRQNWILNGDFEIWQRGTTVTSGTTYGRVGPDRFGGVSDFGGGATFARQTFTAGQTDVPGNPNFFMRFNRGSNNWNVLHWVDDVWRTAEKTFVVSFWGKCSSGTSSQTFDVEQYFGSGGSTSVTVSTTNLGPTYTLSTTWQRFSFLFTVPSIASKTIGAGHCLRIYLTNSTGTGALGLDWSRVMMTEGPTIQDWSRAYPTLDEEVRACQRYFQKTYELGTSPAAGDNIGRYSWVSDGFSSATYNFEKYVQFKTIMRAAPTLRTYNTSNTTINTAQMTSGVVNTTIDTVGTVGGRVTATNGGSATERRFQFHWVADAELA